MNKIKHFLLVICIAGCFVACVKNQEVETYDPVPQFQADTTAIRAFVKANEIPVLKNENYGIFYQIIESGSGSLTYSSSSLITVDYTGKLLNGTTFDTSNGTPVTFTLGNLIPGWQIGLPYIQKGGKIRLFIPSYYGYGNVSKGTIPANSVLDFTISLSDVQ